MNAVLPIGGIKESYYRAYVGYIKNILIECGLKIVFNGLATYKVFEIKIDGKSMIIDFDNFHGINIKYYDNRPYFKFQYCKEKHEQLKNVFSFTKISFYDWQEFFKLEKLIKYKCNSDLIACMQRPRGGAFERRNYVQKILKTRYGDSTKTEFVENQCEFWEIINHCLVHVCVPGARNDILDRGQLQAMAFGCCAISPVLADCLAWNQELVPGVHYISCASDYSDLIEKIEWCKCNRDKCIEIGQNVKKLFNETSTPKKLLEWIELCIKNTQ